MVLTLVGCCCVARPPCDAGLGDDALPATFRTPIADLDVVSVRVECQPLLDLDAASARA